MNRFIEDVGKYIAYFMAVAGILIATFAWGQSPPVKIVGSDGAKYLLYDPDVAVESGLPALTGNKGKVLSVGSDESSIDWTEIPPGVSLSDDKPISPVSGGTAGTAGTASRADHAHPPQAVPALSDASPAAPTTSGSAGDSNEVSRGDHAHPKQSGTGSGPSPSDLTPHKPTSSGAPGTSADYSRGDHAHPEQATTPLSTATPKVASGAGAAGSGGAASRGDHVHPAQALRAYSTATPAAPTKSGTAGTAAEVSRGDHAHPSGSSGGGGGCEWKEITSGTAVTDAAGTQITDIKSFFANQRTDNYYRSISFILKGTDSSTNPNTVSIVRPLFKLPEPGDGVSQRIYMMLFVPNLNVQSGTRGSVLHIRMANRKSSGSTFMFLNLSTVVGSGVTNSDLSWQLVGLDCTS